MPPLIPKLITDPAPRGSSRRASSWSGWLGRLGCNTQATAETRATHPLYDANVSVSELPDKPGAFTCKIMLQPYFQLDDVTAAFNFETEIAPPAVSASLCVSVQPVTVSVPPTVKL